MQQTILTCTPGFATVSFQSETATYSEGNVVEVCAEIQTLPVDGLGTIITVDFLVNGISAGMLQGLMVHPLGIVLFLLSS